MSKKIYITALLIASFAALIFWGPRLLDVDTVRSKVAELVSEKSGWRIDAAQLDWYWLPTPHFSLHNTTITKDGVSMFLPETRIFPLWRSFLMKKIELRKVKLIRPELKIESFNRQLEQPELFLPHAKISVSDGSITLSKGVFAGQAHLFPLTVYRIDAEIDLDPEQSEFELSSKSPQFNFMELTGLFKPGSLGFEVEYEINGLQFYNLLPALKDERLLPVRSAISLQGKIVGQGIDKIQASLIGDFPCFVAPSETESFLLDCGNADLDIIKNGGDLTVKLNELQLKNPGMILSGEIARLTEKNSADDQEPIWLIDLSGKDLDLTAIRKGVLTLWENNHIARTVCDIVLGGKASRASYYFKAPLEGFKDITQMKIDVDVEEAEIHPPATPLFLEKAHGTIKIINGYLSGEGLSARTATNRGDNCTLYLDLAKRNKDFRLDLDIDADLADLKEVLLELVLHKGFHKEVQRFSNIEGRATGHLNIGQTLTEPKVKVRIDTINGGALYEPIPDPIRLRSGTLEILPNMVKWRGVRGNYRPHLIRELSGETSWEKEPFIKINSAQATFDSAALLSELKKGDILPGKIEKAISKVEGVVELNRASISGPLDNPRDWQYSLDVSTSGSRWTSPLLPHPLFAERVRATISRNRIALDSGKIWFLEQPLLIEGNFSHNNFTDWQTSMMLSGTIREPLADWIKQKGWIPDDYFPIIPCTLDKLKVEWDKETLKLSGGVSGGMGGVTSPFVRLQLESGRNHLKIDKLIVSSPEEQGLLSLEYQKNAPKKLNAAWQGFIDSKTVQELLQKNILPAERIEGDFSIKQAPEPGGTDFIGWAKVRDMDWLFNKNRKGYLIKELDITGSKEGTFKINRAVIKAGPEILAINGQLKIGPEKIDFDLGLDTEEITSLTAKQILNDISGTTTEAETEDREIQGVGEDKQLEGVMHFKTGIFRSTEAEVLTGKTSPARYTISPANGFITVDSTNDLYTLDLRNSKLCGLDISATLNFKESKQKNSLILFTDSAAPPLFKDVLPCLGFDNALIDGAVYLDVNLNGDANTWKSGQADLFSDGGYIHRLAFLSKVFRVVNLRDIFSGTNLPDFAEEGFAYSKIDITSHIEGNRLKIDKAFIDGEGLNIFGQGTINLDDWSADLILMVAPLKTVDAVVSKIPLLGKVAGGKDKAVISIPVALKGNLRDPKVTILPPEAIGEGFLNLVGNTLMMPFQILSPLLPETENQ